jgi:all-trans-retinol 13,14-reductase
LGERVLDAVVIGSGAGGLTAALALARAGQRVLVVEQHYLPGGSCHSFQLGGHRFSPGVHYVGDLGPGGKLRAVYEGLGVSKDLAFLQLNSDAFEHIIIGGTRFDHPAGRVALEERLISHFPRQTHAIRRYLALVAEVSDAINELIDLRRVRRLLRRPRHALRVLFHSVRSLDAVLTSCGVTDPMLREILSIQCGDHGLPPSRAPFGMHATVQAHYFEGGWYPRGGGAAIANAFVRALERAGGEVRLSCRVERVLVERDGSEWRAIGVRLADGTEIRAKRVIANADPVTTFRGLVGDEYLSSKLRARLARTRWSLSTLSLFLATDLDVRALGLDSGNYWWTGGTSFNPFFEGSVSSALEPRDVFDGVFVTATSLKDPSKWNGREHTLEVFTLMPYAAFARWAGSPTGQRAADYLALKERLAAQLLRSAERVVPELRSHVTFAEVGTPLTTSSYLGSAEGGMYGTEKSLRQVGPFSFKTSTEIRGLRLTGGSTISHGVMGATFAGLVTAASVLKCSLPALLDAGGPPLETYPADDVSAWPESLRLKVKAASA